MGNRFLVVCCCIFGIMISPGLLTSYSKGLTPPNSQPTIKPTILIDNPSESKWFWNFDKWNNPDGWSVPEILNGSVTGGALWLTIQQEKKTEKAPSWKDQVWGHDHHYELISPQGLSIPAAQYNKIVIRMRNLSPETDGFIRWQTKEKPGVDTGSVRFTMKPDLKEWQEVVCHMDQHWKGTVDRIKIQPAIMWQRGDIWIDWIGITKGENKETNLRPDLCSDNVIPHIKLPGISQNDFKEAFKVLDECLVVDVPLNGFNFPFMAPGGAYGQNWWQLDASLNIAGAKWANQKLTEDMMRGFAGVQAQNPDGRLDLWGGSPVRGEVADVSSLPRYFEAAYDVARRSKDSSLQITVFETMKKYLGYWFSSTKRDKNTGLITGVFEETFSNPHQDPGVIAPVDLNVAVALGCYNTGRLALFLGKNTEAKRFSEDFRQLSSNINRYLWNDEAGVYYNYNIIEKRHDKRLLCTTFDPFLAGIASAEQVEKLVPVLLNPALFNWGTRPLTTVAKTEPGYLEAKGPYDGRAWFGDIWTLRNLPVINGLQNAGKHDLAAELNWSTIKIFNNRYCEYLVPSTGSGEGVQRYGWSASQYIQAIIENLFGVDYDAIEKRIRITPHIPKELLNQEIEMTNLQIPCRNDLRFDLKIIQQQLGKATITVTLKGVLPDEMLEICLPVQSPKLADIIDDRGKALQQLTHIDGMRNVAGVRMKMKNRVSLTFK